mgnify:FL=1
MGEDGSGSNDVTGIVDGRHHVLLSTYDDLDAASAYGWALIARGVTDRKSAFHTPVVATLGLDGGPEVRTVVLRGADLERWAVRFHTDRRSGKVAALTASPRIAMHFYCARSKVQLRLNGVATLHSDDANAEIAWRNSRPMSRACYAQTQAPGAAVAEPALGAASDAQGEEFGRANFVAVEVAVQRFEWLYLAFGGHRRAEFVRDDQGLVTSRWLAP